MVSPVLFAQTLERMSTEGPAGAGVRLFVHVGPGDVTAGMAKRSAPGAKTVAISDWAGISAGLEAIGTIDG